jgi:hypothetical protein
MKAITKAQPKYDEEELEILQALDAGKLKPVVDSKNQHGFDVAVGLER